MAKKLVYNYTFTPGNSNVGNVVFEGNFPLQVIQLITNVTDNIIIYNFADPTKGGTTSYNAAANETTLTFGYNTSTMSSSDKLQIFIDIQEDRIDFSETFIDPVNKLRVSEPQNLIDTDFEYGLQPTKWETIELVNNIPSFYASTSEYTIPDIISVTTVKDSDTITVTTSSPHGLNIGSPIDVQGVDSRTAEGKFLIVAGVTTTSFAYKAKNTQSTSGRIDTSYTSIVPGQFYNSSEVVYYPETGIETDGGSPRSTLTVTTDYEHGFQSGSSIYLTNSIGEITSSVGGGSGADVPTTAIAPDGRPYVDFVETLSGGNISVNNSLSETHQMFGAKGLKFKPSLDVNISTNVITWNDHGLSVGDCLLYMSPNGDTPIGGLNKAEVYYVKSVPNSNSITLCSTTTPSFGDYNNNPTIDISSVGTELYGYHKLYLCYEVLYLNKLMNSYETRIYTRAHWTGSGSGADLYGGSAQYTCRTNSSGNTYCGYFGKMTYYPDRMILGVRPGYNPSSTVWSNNYIYNTTANMFFDFTDTVDGNGHHFVDDYTRYSSWESYDNKNGNYGFYNNQYIIANYVNGFNYGNSGSWSFNYGTAFIFPLIFDSVGDSFAVPGHGLTPGQVYSAEFSSTGDPYRYYFHGNQTNGGTSSSSTFSTFTTNIRVLNSTYIKFVDAFFARLKTLKGTYTINPQLPNATRNTIYVGTNSFVSGQSATFSTGTGGVYPSISGTIPEPTTPTISTVYTALKSGIDNIKTAMGADTVNVIQNGSSFNEPVINSPVSTQGGIQAYSLYRSYNGIIEVDSSNNSQWYYAYFSNYANSGINYANGLPYDPSIVSGQPNTLHNTGYQNILTPYAFNTTTPYFIDVAQSLPYFGRNSQQNRIEWYQNLTYIGTPGENDNTYAYSLWQFGDWRMAFGVGYYKPNASYHGFLSLGISFYNVNWQYTNLGYYGLYAGTSMYPEYSYSYVQPQINIKSAAYNVNILIPVKNGVNTARYGQSGTNISNYQLVNNYLVPALNAAFVAPAYTGSSTQVKLEPVTGSRVRLFTTNGFEYDFLNSGTAPLSVSAGGGGGGSAGANVTGILDGYYPVSSVNPSKKTFTSFLNGSVPSRIIGIGQSNVVLAGSTRYLYVGNHKLKTGQKVSYANTTGYDIDGLSTGVGTYYAIAYGPNHLGLSTTYNNALIGSGVTIGSGTNASARPTIVIRSVSGISSAQGTVGFTSSSSAILGNNTLFRRLFKTGDIIRFENKNTNPSSYASLIVGSVISDTELTTTSNVGFATTSTNYYVETKVNVRPDGAFLHRPFDGGVEINAGTSPNSIIARQTRKYFRYQSGKGIQCSLAINFNPSRPILSLVGLGNTSIQKKTYLVSVGSEREVSYILSGTDRNGVVLGANAPITILQGDTLNLNVSVGGTSEQVWIKNSAVTGTGASFNTGVTNNGVYDRTIIWDTTGISTGTYYYQSQNYPSLSGTITVEPAGITTNIARATTKYEHGLRRNSIITIRGASDSAYVGLATVRSVDSFTFDYYLNSNPSTALPKGIVNYNIEQWSNSSIRAGLFDQQNGMFFEYDGQQLYCVRRSSVQQLPGSATVTLGSNKIFGTDTRFDGQIDNGGYIVVRGMSYRVTKVVSDTEIHIQPAYRGQTASGVIITKTIDTRVPQSQWNIDKADGTGPSGFVLDIKKIQMAYMDYSWYGAGKIRFGFKDTYGHVKYMHEFVHNNIQDEAYMRTGNICGRYEIENTGLPSYVPGLFHWGTSVIMDGKFDDDKAYLFTASSNNLTFTNGSSVTATTNAASALTNIYRSNTKSFDWYVRLSFPSSDASKFSTGTLLYTSNGALNGQSVAYTENTSSSVFVYIFIQNSRTFPAIYPTVGNTTVVNIGAPANATSTIDLTDDVPVISIRLAPTVDNNLTGKLGAREIINRMQLQLKSLGITLSHDCEVDLLLNPQLSNTSYEIVQSPSLSELLKHNVGDKVVGGTKIFSLRASGGTKDSATGKRFSVTTDFDLSKITDLGNSILGGDGVFPNGPDVLTIAIKPVDTSEINASTPLTVSSRITWTESQA